MRFCTRSRLCYNNQYEIILELKSKGEPAKLIIESCLLLEGPTNDHMEVFRSRKFMTGQGKWTSGRTAREKGKGGIQHAE
jgi:hypothetical protein